MGKKARTTSGIAKADRRKNLKSSLPPPPKPLEEEVGSQKVVTEPQLPGENYKVLFGDGYDDGGVADLTLLVDLEDNVLRRKRGDADYFKAVSQDLVPRATSGPFGKLPRREQKIQLAQLLFQESASDEDSGPSEVYFDQVDGEEDAETMRIRGERLKKARAALRLSLLLREPACASLSLSELCKRILGFYGKDRAKDALRCADKAVDIAGDGFWDNDEVAAESEDEPVIDPNYEKNATTPGLAHPTTLKLLPLRASELCMRSAKLQRGNALSALGREEDARASYEEVVPLFENEPRCARLDWERHSLAVNIGNTYSRIGDFEMADEHYKKAFQLGEDHVNADGGSVADGRAMLQTVKRARAFALQRAGRDDEAKALMKEVIEERIRDEAAKKAEEAKEKAEAVEKPADNELENDKKTAAES